MSRPYACLSEYVTAVDPVTGQLFSIPALGASRQDADEDGMAADLDPFAVLDFEADAES